MLLNQISNHIIVDVGSVDTYRPKGQLARKLTNDKFVSSMSPLSEGASGEIADAKTPILPIKPMEATSTC